MNLKKNIYSYLRHYQLGYALFKELETIGSIYLIGGVLREFRDNGMIHSPRDFDIIVDVHSKKKWEQILKRYGLERNRFGGNKVVCGNLIMDIWAMDQTWAFREGIIRCAPDQYAVALPETVFLNIDSIIYDWQRDRWLDAKYREAMASKTIDVVLKDNPQIPLNIVRAFALQQKYSMRLSDNLMNMIQQESKKYTDINEFIDILEYEQERRYDRSLFGKDFLEKKLNALGCFSDRIVANSDSISVSAPLAWNKV